MRVLGLAIAVTNKRSTMRVVLLDDHCDRSDEPKLESITVEASFEIKSDQVELGVQLGEMAESISGRVRSLKPDLVVVRRADRPMKPSNKEGPRIRLLVEGAIAGAAYQVVHATVIRSGKDCGAAYGKDKAGLDADSAALLGNKYLEATAAALSGLFGQRGAD